MCTTLAFSIGLGAAKAVSGISEQNRAHRARVDAVNRSNAMARQKYINRWRKFRNWIGISGTFSFS